MLCWMEVDIPVMHLFSIYIIYSLMFNQGKLKEENVKGNMATISNRKMATMTSSWEKRREIKM